MLHSALSYMQCKPQAIVSNLAEKPNTSSWLASWRTRVSSVLTALTHGSAPSITTFFSTSNPLRNLIMSWQHLDITFKFIMLSLI